MFATLDKTLEGDVVQNTLLAGKALFEILLTHRVFMDDCSSDFDPNLWCKFEPCAITQP
jgi:hypothetical protein